MKLDRVTPTLTPQEFVNRWRGTQLKERSASQSHFNDLCRVLGWPSPTDVDQAGDWYTFERGVGKTLGTSGWADVWLKGHFGWEYKGPKKNLDEALSQLLNYKSSLEHPPLLIVSDMDVIEVHPQFLNRANKPERFTLDDLLNAERRDRLSEIFSNPDGFKSERTTEEVTRAAATEFAKLAERLRERGADPADAAHFLIRLLFCLFAEDVQLLPDGLFTRLVGQAKRQPTHSERMLSTLFGAMSKGGFFGSELIRHFNGGLFNDDTAFELDRDDLAILERVGQLDWGAIEPAIFGTLFERSLDPGKRSQLGAHYTSKEDILLIVEPVLMAPLRRRWAEVKTEVDALAERRDESTDRGARTRREMEMAGKLRDFSEEIASTTVLDPACGSGNFLYVALRQMLDLQKEVITRAGELGLPMFFPTVDPAQLHGIEINEYAHELAQVTIWIGYIQWLRENGFGAPGEPILKQIETIEQRDAILAYDEVGQPVEPEWPVADVIIGNPPFLGTKKLRRQLGDQYVNDLKQVYKGRVSGFADLVCYWFDKAADCIDAGMAGRAGLIATNSIRGGKNRETLEHVAQATTIFEAWSDRRWILDGAAVRVSIVGFGRISNAELRLDGEVAERINPDLTSGVFIGRAKQLTENADIAFIGDVKGGAFDVPREIADQLLASSGNPNGRDNSDVVVPWINSLDVVRRPRDMWIIDFGPDMPMDEASEYEAPFEYVREHVEPIRSKNNRRTYAEYWWRHSEPCRGMRMAIQPLSRFIVTPTVAKHRLFFWENHPTLPDHQLVVIAREDDLVFGVLHSSVHELWSLRRGTWLGAGNDPRYTPTTCFETFPFPWPPGTEPTDSPLVQAIADAARDLVEKRDRWLNPESATEAELKKRTLTNLYNQRPTWLDLAHKKLDEAVLDAYGWPHDIGDEEILERLLALNLERAS